MTKQSDDSSAILMIVLVVVLLGILALLVWLFGFWKVLLVVVFAFVALAAIGFLLRETEKKKPRGRSR